MGMEVYEYRTEDGTRRPGVVGTMVGAETVAEEEELPQDREDGTRRRELDRSIKHQDRSAAAMEG